MKGEGGRIRGERWIGRGQVVSFNSYVLANYYIYTLLSLMLSSTTTTTFSTQKFLQSSSSVAAATAAAGR